MVEVFKTNVNKHHEAQQLIAVLSSHFPQSKINFDLEDCDKVLRMEGEGVIVDQVVQLMQQNGFCCEELV